MSLQPYRDQIVREILVVSKQSNEEHGPDITELAISVVRYLADELARARYQVDLVQRGSLN